MSSPVRSENSDSIQAHLRQVPFFTGLDEAGLKALSQSGRRRKFRAGTALFHEGDAGWTLYIILAGQVVIEKIGPEMETIHIARRGPGEHFGEMALLDDLPRSADAVTETDCDLLMLDRPQLRACLESNPTIGWNIIRSLSARLREAAAKTVHNETQDVLGRLARFLLDETEHAPTDASGAKILPRLTEAQIAQRIGTTRETVNRKIAALQTLKAVRREGRTLWITNPARLRSCCGG